MKKAIITIGILLISAGSAFGYSMPRWGMTSVDVYIEENARSAVVQKAFETWSQATNGKLRFRFYTTRFAANNAPIKVSFLDKQTPFYLTQSRRHETTGYFTDMDAGFINRAEIQIYTINADKKTASEEEIYSNLLTEIGFVLGLEKIYGYCEYESVMCMNSLGKNKALKEKDREMIVKKYERSSEDIKKQKSK